MNYYSNTFKFQDQYEIEYLKFWGQGLLWRIRHFFKRTPILWLHGIGDPLPNQFLLLSELVSRGYLVYGVNMPGHGHSDKIPTVSFELMTEITLAFLNDQDLTKLHLIGCSMGGGTAIRLMMQTPERFSKIGLLVPFCYPKDPTDLESDRKYLEHQVDKRAMEIAYSLNYKKPPIIKPDVFYLASAYWQNFFQFEFDLQHNKLPIKSVLLSGDKVVDPVKARAALMHIKGNHISEVDYGSHALVGATPEVIKQVIDSIL